MPSSGTTGSGRDANGQFRPRADSFERRLPSRCGMASGTRRAMVTKRAQLVERRLAVAEATYVAVLRAALEECAAGRWGLFGQNPSTDSADRYRPAALD